MPFLNGEEKKKVVDKDNTYAKGSIYQVKRLFRKPLKKESP